MSKPKVILVCGARPNFMKIAPVMACMKSSGKLAPYLVHTGQHYDEEMSRSFFDLLNIPRPDINLEVGSGSHAGQTARIMVKFEKVCIKEKPQLVAVVGDVNSTMACAVTAKKLWIPVAHIEAGLRSRDLHMPEEINRMVTDSITDLFFTTDPEGNENLKRSGVAEENIHFAGNVMIDTLMHNTKAAASNPILKELGVQPKKYCLLTMHRPSNVDDRETLTGLLEAFDYIQERLKMIYPAHPRALNMIQGFKLSGRLDRMKNFHCCAPLNYHQFLKLNEDSLFVITDSGGIQEETTVLGIPCLTIRENTERPVTVSIGTNEVVGTNPEVIKAAVDKILSGNWKKGGIPEGWDGKAGERIVEVMEEFVERKVY